MKYQLVKELSPVSLAMKSEEGQNVVLDRVDFPVAPRENLRLEIQKELKVVIQQESEIAADGLLKYSGLEKHEGQLYFVRKNNLKAGLEPFQTVDPGQVSLALLQILDYLKLYHEKGLILGGISQGELVQDKKGKFYLQDPMVMNYLRKSLPEVYRIDAPPEVIHGGNPWTQKSDIFAWGVLAYRLLAGIDPFQADTPEERIAKILNIGAANPKDVKPELSEELSRLVMNCLESDPRKRVDLNSLYSKLTQLVEAGNITVSDTEASEYREKASTNRRRYKMKERFRLWFRKYGMITLIAIGAITFFALTWVGSKSKPVITEKNKPAEVLAYYFEGVKTLNVSLVDETLHKAKNSFSDMVTNLFVINKTQQGMTYSIKDNIKLEFIDLKIEPLLENLVQVRYRISYTLKIAMPAEIQYIERIDNFTLKPVRKVWRITGIDVLQEKRRTEKAPVQEKQGSTGGPQIPTAPAGSNTK